MDESEFTQRLLKATQKNCPFLRSVDIKPRFLDGPDANHVTLVGTVTLSGHGLTQLLLSTRANLPAEISTSYLANNFRYFQTGKGYLTGAAMDFWIDIVLISLITGARNCLEFPFPVSLLLDELRAHFTPCFRDIFARESVIVIPIQPHTRHLYQTLDLCRFGVMKKECKQSRDNSTRSQFGEKLTRKIERPVKAWHHASFPGTIPAAWRSAGFIVEMREGVIQGIRINQTSPMSELSLEDPSERLYAHDGEQIENLWLLRHFRRFQTMHSSHFLCVRRGHEQGTKSVEDSA
jgi:hypothetical protein